MKNYAQLARELSDLKASINELDSMLLNLKRDLIDTVTADGKIISNNDYNRALQESNKLKSNVSSAVSSIYGNL